MQEKCTGGRRQVRHDAILDAAEALFLELGYEKTTLSAVVARSGGSLATLYEQFGNKQKLLHAVIERMRHDRLKGLEGLADEGLSPRDMLRRAAFVFHQFVMAPRTIATFQVVISQSLLDPEFGREFYLSFHSSTIARAAEMFALWHQEGKAWFEDPQAAAELYFATFMCDAGLKCALGMPPEPTDQKMLDERLAPFFAYYRIAD